MFHDGWKYCAQCGLNLSTLPPRAERPQVKRLPGEWDEVISIDTPDATPQATQERITMVNPNIAAINSAPRVAALAAQHIASQAHQVLAPPLNSAARAHAYIAESMAEASTNRQTSIQRTSGKKDPKQQIRIRMCCLHLQYELEDGRPRFQEYESISKFQ